MTKKKFSIREYLRRKEIQKKKLRFDKDSQTRFKNVCNLVAKNMEKEWESEYGKKNAPEILERNSKAIKGSDRELKYFKERISEILKEEHLDTEWFPPFFKNLVDAVFHTNWGLDVINEWFDSKYEKISEACRVVGERVFYLIDGKLVLMPQRISLPRFHQLKEALMLNDEQQRLDTHEAEIYMVDQTRVKIYDEGLAKKKKPCIVFRRQTVKNPTIQDHIDRGTFPEEFKDMLEALMEMKASISITGPMRSAKTAVLISLVKHLPKNSEMFQIESDPEVNLDEILEDNAIIELVTDDPEAITRLRKDVARGDCIDGFILAEIRDGRSLRVLSKMGNIGADGVLCCYHKKAGNNILYNMAQEIKEIYQGNTDDYIYNLAETLDFDLSMTSLENKSEKRMATFEEFSIDPETNQVQVRTLIEYDFIKDDWKTDYYISDQLRKLADRHNPAALKKYEKAMRELNLKNPLESPIIYDPIRKGKEDEIDQQLVG